jgi:zeaxanthin glucosyltransferase
MSHVGVICPNTHGHINAMMAVSNALRCRGHRITFFLLGTPPHTVTSAGIDVVTLGGTIFPPTEYQAGLQKLGTLSGKAALTHTIAVNARSAEAVLGSGVSHAREAGIEAMLVDLASPAGGTVADELGVPFATFCNTVLLHRENTVPPFFTTWKVRSAWWATVRNWFAWTAYERKLAPLLTHIQSHRRRVGLSIPARLSDCWSTRLQISQQPDVLEFPRCHLPKQLHFVGPLQQPPTNAPPDFPWSQLDGRPLVYASLGTLANRLVHVFRAILDGLASEDVQVVVALGRRDATWTLPIPQNALVVGYAPQLDLIDRARLVITHAGLNTTLESLARGKPMLCIPLANDGLGVAARVAHVGAGELLRLEKVTPERVRQLARLLLDTPAYRASAERVRESIRAAGGATRAADLVEAKLMLRADGHPHAAYRAEPDSAPDRRDL